MWWVSYLMAHSQYLMSSRHINNTVLALCWACRGWYLAFLGTLGLEHSSEGVDQAWFAQVKPILCHWMVSLPLLAQGAKMGDFNMMSSLWHGERLKLCHILVSTTHNGGLQWALRFPSQLGADNSASILSPIFTSSLAHFQKPDAPMWWVAQ